MVVSILVEATVVVPEVVPVVCVTPAVAVVVLPVEAPVVLLVPAVVLAVAHVILGRLPRSSHLLMPMGSRRLVARLQVLVLMGTKWQVPRPSRLRQALP